MLPHAVRSFGSTGAHTSLMGWGHHSILGNTVIFLRAEKVASSLQSVGGLVLKSVVDPDACGLPQAVANWRHSL